MSIHAQAQSSTNLERFREKVSAARRKAGKFQSDLADELGIDPKVLSRKLHGAKQVVLTHVEVKKIIGALASWDAITTRDEAVELLSLMGLRAESFTEQEWRAEPLNRLEVASHSETYGTIASSASSHTLSQAQKRSSLLPAPPTTLIGRERQIEHCLEWLRLPSVRLLTLLGTGGVGKTRLALEVARLAQPDFADGVYFVSLATVRETALVPSIILHALRLSEPIARDETGGQSPVFNEDLLHRHLHDKTLLLVLDNVEQIPGIGLFVGNLLSSAAALKIMVTSRSVLRLYGEHEFEVPPLEICMPNQDSDLNEIVNCPAIQLFIERAQAVNPAFHLDRQNAELVARICTRLDGLPLAIELAAVRTKIYSLSTILERLTGASGQGLTFLRTTASNRYQPHQTLRDTLDWSYELLDAGQQRLFRRLGVFLGGWTLPSVATICADEGIEDSAASADDLLMRMESLIDHSLVRQAMPEKETEGSSQARRDEPRFYFLETIRDYAQEQLQASGEREAMQRRHARYFLEMAERIGPDLPGPEQSWAASLLAREQDNLRAALTWAIESGEAELAQRMCGALGLLWEARTQFQEAHRWIDAALAMPQPTPPAIRAKLLMAASRLALWEIACEDSRQLAQQALALYEAVGDERGRAMAIFQIGDTWHMQGEYALAAEYLEGCLEPLREQGNLRIYAFTLSRLGAVDFLQNNYASAWKRLNEAQPLLREFSEPGLINVNLIYLGVLALLQGNIAQSIQRLREALLLAQRTHNRYMIATTLIAFGCVLGMKNGPSFAARVCSAAESLFAGLNTALPTAYRPLYTAFLGSIQAQADQAQWADWWAEGKETAPDEICALVLEASE
jgi:predicted ATPase